MFGLFKKKTEREKLLEQYKGLMDDSFKLSKTDRTASDQKYAEAQEVMNQVDKMDGK